MIDRCFSTVLVKKENATLLLNFCYFLKEMCKIYSTGI